MIYFCTPMLIKSKGLGDVSGARLFPQFLGIALAVVSLIMVVIELRQIARLKKEGVVEETKPISLKEVCKSEWKVVVLIVLMLLYLYLFTHIGFLFSSILLTTAVLFLLGERKIVNYLILYAVVVLIYLGFTKILMVRLP